MKSEVLTSLQPCHILSPPLQDFVAVNLHWLIPQKLSSEQPADSVNLLNRVNPYGAVISFLNADCGPDFLDGNVLGCFRDTATQPLNQF